MKKTKSKKAKDRPVIHTQWIEITRVDGKTVTTFYPPNEEFELERLDMDPPADLIYRRLNFVDGVPTEYMWTSPTPGIQELGGLLLQRIKAEDWPEVLAADRKLGHRLATPASKTVERPECFGPCPCPRCTALRETTPA